MKKTKDEVIPDLQNELEKARYVNEAEKGRYVNEAGER